MVLVNPAYNTSPVRYLPPVCREWFTHAVSRNRLISDANVNQMFLALLKYFSTYVNIIYICILNEYIIFAVLDLGTVFCINLDRRTDRWESVQEEFSRAGIQAVQRFSAVDAVSRKIPGYTACAQSHLNILEHAVFNKIERFTVFEDDVRFIREDTLSVLSKAGEQLPPDWDMLYLGANPKHFIKKTGSNICRLTSAWTTHAMVFNGSRVPEFILNYRNSISKIDVFLANEVQERFNVFITYPMLCTQADDISDVTGLENKYYNTIIDGYNSKLIL